MPCKRGGCDQISRQACMRCVCWEPSPNSRYYKCMRYLASRILCEEPMSACKDCPHRIPKTKRGRPAELGIELPKMADKTEYMREYMRIYRKRG